MGDEAIFGVAGNKKDLYMNEQVPEEEGRKFAELIGAKFSLTSAKEDPESINKFLDALLDEYLKKNGGI